MEEEKDEMEKDKREGEEEEGDKGESDGGERREREGEDEDEEKWKEKECRQLMRPEAELQYEPILPAATPPLSFLGGRLLAEGDSFKFCLGKQQINLLQHMLGSLISSREIRLRGRGTRRVGRKNTAATKDEDDDDGLSLCSDDWWRGKKIKNPLSSVKPDFFCPPTPPPPPLPFFFFM